MVRSPFAPVVLPLAALTATLARWAIQGSGNLYTALHKRFYIPDRDLGWRVSVQHPLWVGLEVCAVMLAIAIGLVIGALWIRRREARRSRPSSILRGLTWLAALPPLVVPVWAFLSGPGPVGGRDTLPAASAAAAGDGLAGRLSLPLGRYDVVAHEGSSITAHLSAGHESFDAVFAGELAGHWQGDPGDLAAPMQAEVSVAAASVDTGIGERSTHAREEYLHADKFPRIGFTLERVLAARQDQPDTVAFRAAGSLAFMGRTHPVEIAGTLRAPDAAGRQRLGLTGDILLLQADLAISIKATALAPDAGDFDGDRLPIHVALVLRRAPPT
jgi:polyisoprenoid-binding protein YceI